MAAAKTALGEIGAILQFYLKITLSQYDFIYSMEQSKHGIALVLNVASTTFNSIYVAIVKFHMNPNEIQVQLACDTKRVEG